MQQQKNSRFQENALKHDRTNICEHLLFWNSPFAGLYYYRLYYEYVLLTNLYNLKCVNKYRC